MLKCNLLTLTLILALSLLAGCRSLTWDQFEVMQARGQLLLEGVNAESDALIAQTKQRRQILLKGFETLDQGLGGVSEPERSQELLRRMDALDAQWDQVEEEQDAAIVRSHTAAMQIIGIHSRAADAILFDDVTLFRECERAQHRLTEALRQRGHAVDEDLFPSVGSPDAG